MKKNYGPLYTLPLFLWLTVFFILPTLIIFFYSFLKKGMYGGVVWEFSLNAYRAIFQPALLKVMWQTTYMSLAATVVTLVLSFPAAYFIARSRHKNIYLLLIIVPFWTNLLIRIFAWISILGNNGFVNNMGVYLGLYKDYIQLLYNPYAVILIITYVSLPFAILPLYASIEKFDFSLKEAASDLGATRWQFLYKIFIPNIRPGIVTAVIFTFIPALGSYAIPQLVGGRDSMMIGNLITRELTTNRNWPLASAMSSILTLVTMLGILVFLRMQSEKDQAAVRKPARQEA
jgi:spermidine/putrescine transport system permease protein